MSSGTLPLATYHRAAALGEGTFGSVVVVYNDEGEEFALKLFIEDEDNDEDNDDDQAEAASAAATLDVLDVGALREISILRLLREANSHRNIVSIADVKPMECGEEEEVGAGTEGCVGMAMPVYHDGTLASAIDAGSIKAKADKVAIAHGLLSAVAMLHRNGIIHRDIKADNVMLSRGGQGDGIDDDDDDNNSTVVPVLIDFSLAKLTNAAMYEKTSSPQLRFGDVAGETHTPSAGTPTYRAPEVINLEPYGLKSDCWSVGVILLEMLTGHTLKVEKDGKAIRLVEEMKAKLPDQPFANMVRGLLEVDPKKRLGACDALNSKLFEKFGLGVTAETEKIVDIGQAFDDEEEENDEIRGLRDATNNSKGVTAKGSKGKAKIDPKLARRQKQIDKVCSELNCEHPLTRHAALTYATHMLALDETIFDGTKAESQGLFDCVVLASKMFEAEVLDLDELAERDSGSFKEWTLEEYSDTETTVWMLMDFCLLPRRLVNWV